MQSGKVIGMADQRVRHVDGIVLAAGSAARFGDRKLLSQLCGKPLIKYTLDAVSRSGCRKTILVVNGYILDELPVLSERVEVVLNEAAGEGICSSIVRGVSSSAGSDAVLLIAADQPLITSALIDSILQEGMLHQDSIVASSIRGVPRNPVLFPSRYYEELKGLSGDKGAKSIVERHAGNVRRVEPEDEHQLLDVDTVQDLERIRSIMCSGE